MNYSFAVVVLTSCLLATAMTATPNGLNLPVSCSAICNTQCTLSDTSCRLIPGLGAVCDATLAACTNLCSLSCRCFDGCVSRCRADGEACNSEGTFQDAALCSVTQTQCLASCPVSCGLKTGSTLFNALLGVVNG